MLASASKHSKPDLRKKSSPTKKNNSLSRPQKPCKSRKKTIRRQSKLQIVGPCVPVENQKGQGQKGGKGQQKLRQGQGQARSETNMAQINKKYGKSNTDMRRRHSIPKTKKDKDRDPEMDKEVRDRKKREKDKYLRRQERLKRASRRMSNLVFVMPRGNDDPQVRMQLDAEKKMNKLIRYLKKYWTTHIDKKFYPVKIDLRMQDRMTHQRPDNWWLLKRARQKMYEHTGFFSNVREPYHDLGPPELDSTMLIFNNLHEDLITDPTKWITDRKIKDDLIRKCNAPLERLPRARVRRPQFAKGRIKVGAGGMLNIDKYVKTGFSFLNNICGNVTFTQTLNHWMEHKENEVVGLASAFGFVPRKGPGPEGDPSLSEAGGSDSLSGPTKSNAKFKKHNKDIDELDSTELKSLSNDGKKASSVDDRLHHRNMVLFEKMMQAIHDIIRSILNIRASHLRSNYPLPLRMVTHIRSVSPRDSRIKDMPPIASLTSCHAPTAENLNQVTSKVNSLVESKAAVDINSKQQLAISDSTKDKNSGQIVDKNSNQQIIRTSMMVPPRGSRNLSRATSRQLSLQFSLSKAGPGGSGQSRSATSMTSNAQSQSHSLLAKPPPRLNTADLVENIKRAYLIKESRVPVLPEDKVKMIQEAPNVAVGRLKLVQDKYNKLFSRGEKSKIAIWNDIDVDNLYGSESKSDEDVLQSINAEVTFAGHNQQDKEMLGSTTRLSIPSTPKIPHISDIPTPTLAGLESPPALDSEEQSRENLLKLNPEAARKEPPPSPVQRLLKTAGIETTEKHTFNTLMALKKKFRNSEKALKFYYANETEKSDWETMMRFLHKIEALEPCPIFEKSINRMRASLKYKTPAELALTKAEIEKNAAREKRPALWYRKLKEQFDEIGASRHLGCASTLLKLFRYCDVDMKTKPKMLNRFCLLVVSLPTTELGTRHWQHAIKFILEHLLGVPGELFFQWLDQRRLPSII